MAKYRACIMSMSKMTAAESRHSALKAPGMLLVSPRRATGDMLTVDNYNWSTPKSRECRSKGFELLFLLELRQRS